MDDEDQASLSDHVMIERKWSGAAEKVNPEWKIRGWALKEKLDKEKEEERLGTKTGPTLADAWIRRSGSDQQVVGWM